MGNCGGGPRLTPEQQAQLNAEKQINKQIGKQMLEDVRSQDRILKILLLGAGESGKSTLFKQLVTIYGKGYTEADRREFTANIFENVIGQMKVLCKQTEKLEVPGCKITNADSLLAKQFIDELKADEKVSADVAKHVTTLWADSAIVNTYANRSLFQLYDSCKYFFEKVHEIAQPNYIPTQDDILHSRVRTTGIVETQFLIQNNTFKMFDVGGQRNERKKWIHCFENVTTVFFVGAISEYDQKLFEDRSMNRMQEALNLFEEIVNSPFFTKTSVVLFLNKRDLFAEKITKVPLTVCFPEYKGGNDFKDASEYITAQFVEKCSNPDKTIYCHVTCATDQSNVRFVFEAVKDIIITKNLEQSGIA